MRRLPAQNLCWDKLPLICTRRSTARRKHSNLILTKLGASCPAESTSLVAAANNIVNANALFTNKYRALVLDSTYQPIDVITWQRAICLDIFDKVDVLEYYDMYVKSAYEEYLVPAVLRVRLYVARNRRVANTSISRRHVMLRDRFMCQYCSTTSNLTIDHVIPASKGGLWEWTNLVTACTKCNGKKGDKSLKQLKWKLRKEPKAPSAYELGLLMGGDFNISAPPKEWLAYLYELQKKGDAAAEEQLAALTVNQEDLRPLISG